MLIFIRSLQLRTSISIWSDLIVGMLVCWLAGALVGILWGNWHSCFVNKYVSWCVDYFRYLFLFLTIALPELFYFLDSGAYKCHHDVSMNLVMVTSCWRHDGIVISIVAQISHTQAFLNSLVAGGCYSVLDFMIFVTHLNFYTTPIIPDYSICQVTFFTAYFSFIQSCLNHLTVEIWRWRRTICYYGLKSVKNSLRWCNSVLEWLKSAD